MDLDQQLSSAVALDEDALLRQIGIIEEDPRRVAGRRQVLEDAEAQEGVIDFPAIGRRVFAEATRQSHDLLCGSGDDYEEERDKIQDALGSGADAIAKAFAAFLISTGVGLPAAAVVFVASLFAKIAVRTGLKVVCDVWEVPAEA